MSTSSDQPRAPAVMHSPPRQVETRSAYRKRLAQDGESSSRPTYVLPVNPISAQTESAVMKALIEYNQMLIEQNHILMEQNQTLLKQAATLEGRVEAQEEQIRVLFERTNDLKQEPEEELEEEPEEAPADEDSDGGDSGVDD
ncbi:hypothetical protein Hanom_Chr07g00635581 [Helianthus anomalus]